jgi:hypothetical protein
MYLTPIHPQIPVKTQTRYQARKNQIDESLLKRRNEIAHGEQNIPKKEDFLALYSDIIDLIDNFRTDLENICCTQSYKRA